MSPSDNNIHHYELAANQIRTRSVTQCFLYYRVAQSDDLCSEAGYYVTSRTNAQNGNFVLLTGDLYQLRIWAMTHPKPIAPAN